MIFHHCAGFGNNPQTYGSFATPNRSNAGKKRPGIKPGQSNREESCVMTPTQQGELSSRPKPIKRVLPIHIANNKAQK
jgi:hypothetical protein